MGGRISRTISPCGMKSHEEAVDDILTSVGTVNDHSEPADEPDADCAASP